MLLAFSFQDLFNAFKPVIQFLQDTWSFLNTGVYDAYTDLIIDVPIVGTLFKPITDLIEDATTLDEFFNNYTVLTVSLASGLSLVLILTIVGFFTDKVGL